MSGEKCGYSRLSLKFFLGEIGFTQYTSTPSSVVQRSSLNDDGQIRAVGQPPLSRQSKEKKKKKKGFSVLTVFHEKGSGNETRNQKMARIFTAR